MTSLNPITFSLILESLLSANDLTEEQSNYLMNSWLENNIEPVQTGAFLAAFRARVFLVMNFRQWQKSFKMPQ